MRILVLSDYFKDYHENLASFHIREKTAIELARRGNIVQLVYPGHHLRPVVLRLATNCISVASPAASPKWARRGGFGLLDCLYKCFEAIRGQYDIVHVTNGHRPSQLIPCLCARLFSRAKLIDERWEWLGKGGYADDRKGISGMCIGIYDRLLEIRVACLFNHIVVISTALGKRFEGHASVSVLYGGAETDTLHPLDIQESRKKVAIDPGLFCIGMSNLTPSDHRENAPFLKAFSALCSDHPELRLIATGSDARHIRDVGNCYGIFDRIIAPGYVPFPQYNDYLNCCNVFVLPYSDTNINRGRWPNKLGDYMALGRPVVTNPTGDVKTVFERYRVGFLCGAAADDYYSLLQDILSGAIDLRHSSKDSEHVARRVISFDRRIDRLLQLFRVGYHCPDVSLPEPVMAADKEQGTQR